MRKQDPLIAGNNASSLSAWLEKPINLDSHLIAYSDWPVVNWQPEYVTVFSLESFHWLLEECQS